MKRIYSSEVFLQQLSILISSHILALSGYTRNNISNPENFILMKHKALNTFAMKKVQFLTAALSMLFVVTTLTVAAEEVQHNPESAVNYNMQVVGCASSITPEDGDAKPLDGFSVFFLLRIKNTGTSVNTFTLVADDFDEFDENPDGSSTDSNVDLNQSLEDLNHNPFNGSVTLAPGETYDFYLKISKPHGTAYDQWNGTRITATSQSCPDNTNSTVVHTFIPVPDGVIIGMNDFILPSEGCVMSYSALTDNLLLA